ncbi:MAG TPA: hypothetical protein VK858_16465 [Longimicrobiales bacterium]|nr:hypothetical protein [Longimicrobiales bacterium]
MDTKATLEPPSVGRRTAEHRIFSASAILLLLLAAVGFTASVIARTRGGVDLVTPRFVLHGTAGFLWLSFYVLQTQLVLRGRVGTHRAMGKIGVGLILLLGLATAYLLLSTPSAYPEAPIDAVGPAIGMHLKGLTFDVLVVALALAYRRRPFVHKRLMYFATVGIASPGFTRLGYVFGDGEAPGFSIALALAFVAVLFVYDLRAQTGLRRWMMPLCVVALFLWGPVISLVMPGVFTSQAWYDLLLRMAGR